MRIYRVNPKKDESESAACLSYTESSKNPRSASPSSQVNTNQNIIRPPIQNFPMPPSCRAKEKEPEQYQRPLSKDLLLMKINRLHQRKKQRAIAEKETTYQKPPASLQDLQKLLNPTTDLKDLSRGRAPALPNVVYPKDNDLNSSGRSGNSFRLLKIPSAMERAERCKSLTRDAQRVDTSACLRESSNPRIEDQKRRVPERSVQLENFYNVSSGKKLMTEFDSNFTKNHSTQDMEVC